MRFAILVMMSGGFDILWRKPDLAEVENVIRDMNQKRFDLKLSCRIYFIRDLVTGQEWVSTGNELGLIPLTAQNFRYKKLHITLRSGNSECEFYNVLLGDTRIGSIYKIKGCFFFPTHLLLTLHKVKYLTDEIIFGGDIGLTDFIKKVIRKPAVLLNSSPYELFLLSKGRNTFTTPIILHKYTDDQLQKTRRKYPK